MASENYDVYQLKADFRKLALDLDEATEAAYAMDRPKMTKANKISNTMRALIAQIARIDGESSIFRELLYDPEPSVRRQAAVCLLVNLEMESLARKELVDQIERYTGTWRASDTSMLLWRFDRGHFMLPS